MGVLKAYTHRVREGTSQILTADVASEAVTCTEPAPFGSLSTRGEDGPIYSTYGSAVAFDGKRAVDLAGGSERRPRCADQNVRFVDASQLRAMPGLWETHTHEWIGGKFYSDRLGRLWLAYGVTELQSEGDPVYRAVETREAFGSGERVGRRFFASGEAIGGKRVYYNVMRPTLSEAQLELELSRAKTLDYDLVKTYARCRTKCRRRR